MRRRSFDDVGGFLRHQRSECGVQQHLRQALWALSEKLILMATGQRHDRPDTNNVLRADRGMCDVRHAVNKHFSWCPPLQRFIYDGWMHHHTEPGTAGAWIAIDLVFGRPHRLESL